MSFILHKTEDAFVDVVLSSSLSASVFDVYTGLGGEDKEAPAFIVTGESATEDFPDSGIWHVKTELKVKEMAADSNVTSSLSSDIFEVLLTDNTKTVLSNYPGYYCYDLFVEDTANTQEGDAWVQTVRLDVVCALT